MLTLNNEFKETVCRLFIEKNYPQKFKTIIQEHKDPSFSELVLQRKTFYDVINTTEGFLTLQGYFIKAALLLDRDNEAGANDAHNLYN